MPFGQWCVLEDLSSSAKRLVLVLVLKSFPHSRVPSSKSLFLRFTKSSTIIPRTLINFVHYQFITNKLKKCWTIATDIPKPVMLAIGAHSLMSHWSDVLSGITQFSAWPCFLCNLTGYHYFRQLSKPAQHRCQQYHWTNLVSRPTTLKLYINTT